jgi:Rps23 Pro-64 3,4-dihydroxylase Tpa1-like proline 4-hydroxylase
MSFFSKSKGAAEMQSSSMNTLVSIDYEGLYKLASVEAVNYKNTQPFPHIMLESLFDSAMLEAIVDSFPTPDQSLSWRRTEAKLNSKKMQFNKLGMPYELEMPLIIRQLILEMNSGPFLRFLESLTGIEGLLPDPSLQGGGIHQILPGGVLGVHADFTQHKVYGLDRRINVLLYFNHDWKPEYGGHLELWSRDMSECVRRIKPDFGRCVIFDTDATSFHGHPEEVACQKGTTRKSLALYYYTNGRAGGNVEHTHATNWQERPSTLRPDIE